MKFTKFTLASLLFCSTTGFSQTYPEKVYRNFPVVLSVQFHSLSFPFKNLTDNFKNVGIGIGTEIALGNKHNWAQEFQLSWYRNRAAGNGIILYSQSAWRPTIQKSFFISLKAGAGMTYNFRPVGSYVQKEGRWSSVRRRGKLMFTVPIGAGAGFHAYQEKTYISPFGNYQILFVKGYAKSIPVVPYSLLQFGGAIHLH